MSMSLLDWGAQNWTHNSRSGLTNAHKRGWMTLHDLLVVLCLMLLWLLLTFFAARALLANGQPGVHQEPPGSFSAELLSSWAVPSINSDSVGNLVCWGIVLWKPKPPSLPPPSLLGLIFWGFFAENWQVIQLKFAADSLLIRERNQMLF